MGKINVKFGHPTSLEEQELLSERAIDRDCSIEAELCAGFEYLLNSLINRAGKDKFFDLIFLVITGKQAKSPMVSYGVYFENGYKFPMIVMEDDYLRMEGSERLFISNDFVNELGKIYQTELDYEYVGFERVA